MEDLHVRLAHANKVAEVLSEHLNALRAQMANSIVIPIRLDDVQTLFNGLASGHFNAEMQELTHKYTEVVAQFLDRQVSMLPEGAAFTVTMHVAGEQVSVKVDCDEIRNRWEQAKQDFRVTFSA